MDSDPVQKKKRMPRVKKEKKPIQVVAVVTPDGIEGTFTPEPKKPLIVHLPFNSTQVEFNDTSIRYDPNPPNHPEPYNSDSNLYFQVNSEVSTNAVEIGVEQEGWKIVPPEEEKTGSTEVQKPISIVPNTQHKLLNCYSVKNGETFKVPDTTSVACFWCSYNFPGSPFFLPVKEESSVYSVYGNFCSCECGLSFLLHEHIDSHIRWERMSLLHRMYKIRTRIHPAPPRESLDKFGGPYTYEQFRSINEEKKVRVDISHPPMVSILGVLDTKPIDFFDSSLQNTFTGGFSMDRFKFWSEQGGALRLKRSKPLKDRESTLDSCIQITVKRVSE